MPPTRGALPRRLPVLVRSGAPRPTLDTSALVRGKVAVGVREIPGKTVATRWSCLRVVGPLVSYALERSTELASCRRALAKPAVHPRTRRCRLCHVCRPTNSDSSTQLLRILGAVKTRRLSKPSESPPMPVRLAGSNHHSRGFEPGVTRIAVKRPDLRECWSRVIRP